MVYMVGTIRNEDNSIKEFILYKFYENSTHRISCDELYKGIKNNKIKVNNLDVDKYKIICTEGNIDYYTIYDNDLKVIGDLKLVILGSNACSYKGDRFYYVYMNGLTTIEHLIMMQYKNQLANGVIDIDKISVELWHNNIIYSRSRLIDNRVKKYIAKTKLLGTTELYFFSHTHGITLYKVEKADTNEFVVPDFVNKIGAGCFKVGVKASKLIIPDNVIELEQASIYNTNFREIQFGSGLEDLKNKMTLNWKLEKLTLPSTLKVIPNNLVNGSSKLTELFIPDSVEKIEQDAFYNSAIQTLYISKNNTYFKDKKVINGIKVQVVE